MSPRGPRKLETPEVFQVTVDLGQFSIVVEEKSGRPGYLIMRRWLNSVQNWDRKAIGRLVLRDARGAVLPAAIAAAKDAATNWYQQITGQAPEPTASAPSRPFTIGETWAAISDEKTGKYPHRKQFRDELESALRFASSVWGTDTAWASITALDWTKLIRARIDGLLAAKKDGLRATEITVSRLRTVVLWLRGDAAKIPAGAAELPKAWRDGLSAYWKGSTKRTEEPEPHQPFYTLEESIRLLNASAHVDPRVALLAYLGAELRLGQVVRAKRTDLNLVANEFTVRGSDVKQGTVVDLTAGQRAAAVRALAGYLRIYEARFQAEGIDYNLFPGGRLTGTKTGDRYVSGDDPRAAYPLSRAARIRWWRAVEVLANISHVDGRGPYGIRRAAVNLALDDEASDDALMNLGGWSTTDVPRRTYQERQHKAGRKQATPIRRKLRGEAQP